MPKIIGNNRLNALKRTNTPYSTTKIDRRPMVGIKTSSITDARQILINRNQTSFDARQLLTRQTSKQDNVDDKMVVVTGLKDMKMKDGRFVPTPTINNVQEEKKKKIFAVGTSTFVTIRNNNGNTSLIQSMEKTSLTKTIKNTSVRNDDDTAIPSSSNQKVLISFVNDKYEKNPSPPPPPPSSSSTKHSSSAFVYQRDPPPVIKRLHDASIQTTPSSSSSRSPIRMNSYRRQNSSSSDDYNQSQERTIDDDLYEPPVKRSTSSTRKTTTRAPEQQMLSTVSSTSSVKRTSTGVPVSSRTTSSTSAIPKESSTTIPSNSTSGTILVTNLQPSVTEDDVIELFGQIGRITEIKTLSEGCIRIIYAKREHAEHAVTKYHNRLLDGQFMYVSLQQTTSHSVSQTVKPKSVIQQATKDSGTTSNSSSSTNNQPLKFNTSNSSNTSLNKFTIDPTFFRQALFHPTNNSTNPVQFQVKL